MEVIEQRQLNRLCKAQQHPHDAEGHTEEEAYERVLQMDRQFRRNRPKKKNDQAANTAIEVEALDEAPPEDADAIATTRWQDALLSRLHQLSPGGFEEFVLYLLRLYGLELARIPKLPGVGC